ncbi:MAG: energy transducer TonB [Acidobacteria bacterium]|nr:energy transducer TonB [Acidobacteriota bacterium]
MKICPTCQSSYPDGFKYCPQDNNTLLTGEEFARRSQPVTAPVITESVPEVATISVPPSVIKETVVSIPETQAAAQYIAPRDFEYSAPGPEPEIEAPVEETPRAVASAATVSAATAATNGTAKLTPAPDFGLNLAMPEPKSLVSRLFASFQNIKDIRFGGGAVAAGATQDFQVLIPDESLLSRILREIGLAWQDFRRNPKQFFVELMRGDGSNLRRRNMLLVGSEMALVGYATVYFSFWALAPLGLQVPTIFKFAGLALSLFLVGCYVVRGFLLSRLINQLTRKIVVSMVGMELATWGTFIGFLLFLAMIPSWFCAFFPSQCGVVLAKGPEYRLLEPTLATEEPKPKPVEKVQKEIPKGKGDGFTGGSKPKPQQAQGGGGQNTNAPVSKGVPPQMTQLPQVMPPTLRTPTIKNPSLVVPTTTQGDDALSKAMAGRIGLPDGADAPPSLGTGKGTGLGPGEGGGQGPGRGGNKGGGDMAIGGGPGDGGSGGIFQATASMKPTIVYKEKAKYTEAARQNRVQGTVLVSAVFTADGKVTAIRVIRGLPDGLNDEAIKAAQKIRFTPAMKNGQPVSVRMSMEFSFNLL